MRVSGKRVWKVGGFKKEVPVWSGWMEALEDAFSVFDTNVINVGFLSNTAFGSRKDGNVVDFELAWEV